VISIADPEFGETEQEAVARILESGLVADGPVVRAFEMDFADYCGTDHAVATANGTAALHAALEALDLGDGDRVVTTPFSFVASANAIRLAGATPVFADIDPETYNLDPEAARDAVRAFDADAILVVHLYGLPAEMATFRRIADEEDVALVEDAAQAHGARYAVDGTADAATDGDHADTSGQHIGKFGQHVGTFGDATAFSFYPTKNMTTGEGGMVVTDDETVADRAASFVNHGRPADGGYSHVRLGHNFRMTSLAAAIGRIQLDKLPDWVRARRENAAYLTDRLDDVAGVEPPAEPSGRRHAYHQYTVRCRDGDRDRLQSALAERGVGSGVYYPTPIPDLDAYAGDVALSADDGEHARRAAEEVLSLPVHPDLSAADREQIVAAVRAAAPRGHV
jgi:dTDP-4-amino-4,6-dideoxygalactose transaminase